MTVDAFIYTGPSLLNQFFCDSAIIDKTLFYDILHFQWVMIMARVPEKCQALFFTFFRQHSPCPDRTGFF